LLDRYYNTKLKHNHHLQEEDNQQDNGVTFSQEERIICGIDATLNEAKLMFGHRARLFDYFGDKEADFVIVTFGYHSYYLTEAIASQMPKDSTKRIGIVLVRLLKPWSSGDFLRGLPKKISQLLILVKKDGRETNLVLNSLLLDVTSALSSPLWTTNNPISTPPYISGCQFSSKQFSTTKAAKLLQIILNQNISFVNLDE